MSIPVNSTKSADELLVAEILASWSIEENWSRKSTGSYVAAPRRLDVPFNRAGHDASVHRADARTARAESQ
jgi:hypothetical protein